MTGDEAGLAAIVLGMIVVLCAGCLKTLSDHPWLLAFVPLGIVAYVLARRAQARERDGHY